MLWLLPLTARAADVIVGGIVTPQVAVDLPPLDRANRFLPEDNVESHTWARGFASGEFDSGDRWFLEARVQYHLLFGGTSTDGWWDASVGDSGWDGQIAGPLRLRVGMLTERWGKMNVLPGVADLLNPRDLRSGLQTPIEFRRIPIPMAIFSLGSDVIRSETVLIPVSTSDRLFVRETDWAISRQGFLEGLVTDVRDWSGSEFTETFTNAILELQQQSPQFRRNLDQAVSQTALPESLVINGEIAERLEIRAGRVDLGLMGGYLRTRTPQTQINPYFQDVLQQCRDVSDACGPLSADEAPTELRDAIGDGIVFFEWPRTAIAGADVSFVAGPVQIRGETMFQSARPVRLQWGGGRTLPQLGGGIGVDYVRGSNLTVTVESVWTHLFDAPDDLLLAVEDQVQVAGGVRWSPSNALTLQLGAVYDFSFREGLVTPSVAWRANDHVQLDLSALMLGGRTDVPRDIYDALTYQAGPLSYFGQNDVVTLSASFIR